MKEFSTKGKPKFSTKEKLLVFLYAVVGVLYFPLYLFAWLLRIVSRFFLALSYFGMLEGRKGKDVFKSLFSIYVGKY